jgi:hypothetical protein
LKKLGLVFEVRLPRQGPAQQCFNEQVIAFCEDKGIDLKKGSSPEATDWVLMVRRTRDVLGDEVLTRAEFTTKKLKEKPFNKLRNYLADDEKRRILFIGAILPLYFKVLVI